MGLDIYFTTNKNKIITTINSLESISIELFEFQKLTGITIDEYGKTNFYLDHIKLLLKLIEYKNEWTTIFELAVKENTSIIIIGD